MVADVRGNKFDLVFRAASGEWTIRRGKIFEAGEYPDKKLTVTEQELAEMVANFKPVPINHEHESSLFDGHLGELIAVFHAGPDLVGDVKIPKWLDDLMELDPLRVSIELSHKPRRIVGLALTISPRVQDAAVARFSEKGLRKETCPTMDEKSLFSKLAAFFGLAAQGEEKVDEAIAKSKADTVAAEFASLKASHEALATQLAELKAVKGGSASSESDSEATFSKAANQYFDALLKNKRVLPAHKDAIVAAFTQALKSELPNGVSFSVGGTAVESPLAKALFDSFNALPEVPVAGESKATVITDESNGAKMSAERRAELLGYTSFGQTILEGGK